MKRRRGPQVGTTRGQVSPNLEPRVPTKAERWRREVAEDPEGAS